MPNLGADLAQRLVRVVLPTTLILCSLFWCSSITATSTAMVVAVASTTSNTATI
uniref:Uncharacterized protein n=1 Tax=Arundo donax TaxID=35708 RepID=A0A0A9B414_ARUDO